MLDREEEDEEEKEEEISCREQEKVRSGTIRVPVFFPRQSTVF